MPANSNVAKSALPHVHRVVLNNGLVVLVIENPAADIVAARIFVKSGSRHELEAEAGLAHLLSTVLTKGTEGRSSQEIAEQVESVGASLGADSATDYFLLSLKTVSADFANILQLAAEILRSPTFPTTEVDLERRLVMQGIRSMQEQPFSIANQQLRQIMYRDHPYALPVLGTEETVSQLDQAKLQRYHQTHFRPDNMVISVAGRIRPEQAIALIEQVFGDWSAPTTEDGSVLPLPPLTLPTPAVQPEKVVTVQDTQQAIVMLGYLTASVRQEDYAALKLLNTYLGNGLSSRLFVELREKRGLAYDVSAFYPTRLDASQFVVYMGTAPTNAAIALEGLHAEVDRLCNTTLTPEELQSAQNKLLGQYALGKQTNAQLAHIYGWYETLGLGIGFDHQFQEWVAAVTAEDAQEIASRYFSTAPYVSLVGSTVAVNQLSAPVAS